MKKIFNSCLTLVVLFSIAFSFARNFVLAEEEIDGNAATKETAGELPLTKLQMPEEAKAADDEANDSADADGVNNAASPMNLPPPRK